MKSLRTASIFNIVLLGIALSMVAAGHVRVSIALIAIVCLINTRSSFAMFRMVTAALFSRGSKR